MNPSLGEIELGFWSELKDCGEERKIWRKEIMGVGEGWDGKYKWGVGSCVYTERITKLRFGLVCFIRKFLTLIV